MGLTAWPHLLAVSFVSPGFAIAGLALMALPIVIHLLNRRRFKEVEWAAMTFLRRALEHNRRRMQFEQWVVLAIRCLLIGLMGLALSRPVGCGGSAGGMLGQREGLVVLVVDNSYSMQMSGGGAGESHLARGKRLAGQMIRAMGGGGRSISIVTAGAEAEVVLRPTYDMTAALEAVDAIEQTEGTTDLPGAVARVEEVMEEARAGVSVWVRVVTDGTRSSVSDRQVEQLKQAMGRLMARSSQGMRPEVAVHVLGDEGQSNNAAVELVRRGPVMSVGRPVELVGRWMGDRQSGAGVAWAGSSMQRVGDAVGTSAGVASAGAASAGAASGAAGGGVGGAGTGGETWEQTFVGSANVAGYEVAVLGLSGVDKVAVDDVTRRVFELEQGVGIWVVDGERAETGTPTSAGFVAMALAPPAEAGDGSRSVIATEVIRDFELADRLSRGESGRAIVLCGVSRVTEETAMLLAKFVEGGGLLVNVLGDGTDAATMNAALGKAGLLPGAILGRVELDEAKVVGFDAARSALAHPLMAVFRGVENSGLDRVRVKAYWRMSIDAKSERVLSFGGEGDAAVLAHAKGGGRVITILTSGGGDGWNDLPAKPAFVPLVNELVLGSISSRDGWLTRMAGERVVVPRDVSLGGQPVLRAAGAVAEGTAGASAGVTDGLTMQFRADAAGGGVWESEPVKRSGVYELTDGTKSWPVAVNVDAANEADVRVVTRGAIAEVWGAGGRVVGEELEAEVAGGGDDRADFGWVVMLVVLGLVGLECFAAMWFGRGK